MAGLAGQVQAQAEYTSSRTSGFSYYKTTDARVELAGLLKSETIEPGNPELCLVKSYEYDQWGNRSRVTTSHCTGASPAVKIVSRTSSTEFAAVTVALATKTIAVPVGMQATTLTNALGQSETRKQDPRFGVVLSLTGPNALSTAWEVDDFGRVIKEIRADGTRTVTRYCILKWVNGVPTGAIEPGASSDDCTAPNTDEVPADAHMFTHTEVWVGTRQIGPFSRVYTDRAGRQRRSITEADDGRRIAQDTDYNAQGVQSIVTQPYFLDSQSSLAAGGGHYGMRSTEVDVLGRVVAVYSTDEANIAASGGANLGGSQRSISFGSRGSYQASKSWVEYDGLVTTSHDDQGNTRIEEKNANAQVVRTTDALGAQVVHQHDAFGNLVATKDALQNSIAVGYDDRGRKIWLNDPDAGRTEYSYNVLGELTSQRSAKQIAANQKTAMVYDVLGRMTQRSQAEYTSNWVYDSCPMGKGKLCRVSTDSGLTRTLSYDSKGRPEGHRVDVVGGPKMASVLGYNDEGRLASQTYPSGVQVLYGYSSNGYLKQLSTAQQITVNPLPPPGGGSPAPSRDLRAGTVLWSAQSYNAWGRVEQSSLSSGVSTRLQADALTGRTLGLVAGVGTATNVMSVHYTWNSLGQVTRKDDDNGDGVSGAVTDIYRYDTIGRLENYRVESPSIPGLSRSVDLEYNAAGMLLRKSDVGNYVYGAQGPGAVRPHALLRVSGVDDTDYTYDANGNLITASAGAYRSISYTSFNLPDSQNGLQGPGGTPKYLWQYDENHQRIKESRTLAAGPNAGTRVTWMFHPDNQGGLGFEREVATSGANQNRHYLSVGGQSIGVLITTDDLAALADGQMAPPPPLGSVTAVKLEYWHKDMLGSLVATSDQAGTVTARYSYDPFGKRRQASGTYDAFGTLIVDWSNTANAGTDRGYTGHEHLDEVGIVHMNGRLFDPATGRFIQPDPLLQEPGNLQNFNRYGYCYQNPVTCTDPSGHFFFLAAFYFTQSVPLMIAAAAADIALAKASPALRPYIGITWSIALGGPNGLLASVGVETAAAQTFISGFAAGTISSGNIEGGIQGAMTAVAFMGTGNFLQFSGGADDFWPSVAAHAVTGCVTSEFTGGKCGAGALSAGFAKAATFAPGMQGITDAARNGDIGARIAGTAISAIVGGTASTLGGGKFSNGAVSGAFSYLFNALATRRQILDMYDEVKPRGHHINPQNRVLANRELISDEAADQLANSRIGDGVVSKGYSGDPHSGSHPHYDRAWQHEFDAYASKNGIDANNPMTRQQAILFEAQLRQNAVVRQYLQDIADFIAERARLGRQRVNIRIINGVKGLD